MVDYFNTGSEKDVSLYKPSSFDIDKILENLMKCITPKESEAKEICSKARDIFVNEENLISIEAPATVSKFYINI